MWIRVYLAHLEIYPAAGEQGNEIRRQTERNKDLEEEAAQFNVRLQQADEAYKKLEAKEAAVHRISDGNRKEKFELKNKLEVANARILALSNEDEKNACADCKQWTDKVIAGNAKISSLEAQVQTMRASIIRIYFV